jgi:hypothetical protein
MRYSDRPRRQVACPPLWRPREDRRTLLARHRPGPRGCSGRTGPRGSRAFEPVGRRCPAPRARRAQLPPMSTIVGVPGSRASSAGARRSVRRPTRYRRVDRQPLFLDGVPGAASGRSLALFGPTASSALHPLCAASINCRAARVAPCNAASAPPNRTVPTSCALHVHFSQQGTSIANPGRTDRQLRSSPGSTRPARGAARIVRQAPITPSPGDAGGAAGRGGRSPVRARGAGRRASWRPRRARG